MFFKLAKLMLLSFVIFFFCLIITTSVHVRFWADDFCTGAVLNRYGFWGSQNFSWLTWSGRYSYNFFLYLFMYLSPALIRYLPLIIFGFITFSLWPLLNRIFNKRGIYFNLVIAALLILTVLINTPNIIQSFYWYGGSLIYALPFSFFNLFLALLVSKYRDQSDNKRNRVLLLSFTLLFIAGGFAESFAVVQIVILSGILAANFVIKWRGRKAVNQFVLSGLLGLTVSLLVMYSAPGTMFRSSTLDKPLSLWWVSVSAFNETKQFFIYLVNSKPFIYSVFLVFAVIYTGLIPGRKTLRFKFPRASTLIIIITSTALVSALSLYAVSFYSMAYHPPERALFIIIYDIFLSFSVICIIPVLLIINNIRLNLFKYVNIVIFLILLMSLVFLSRDTFRRWRFLRNDMMTYADAWDLEERKLLESRNTGGQVVISHIPPIGRIDGFKDNKGWIIGCMTEYYRLKSITIKD